MYLNLRQKKRVEKDDRMTICGERRKDGVECRVHDKGNEAVMKDVGKTFRREKHDEELVGRLISKTQQHIKRLSSLLYLMFWDRIRLAGAGRSPIWSVSIGFIEHSSVIVTEVKCFRY